MGKFFGWGATSAPSPTTALAPRLGARRNSPPAPVHVGFQGRNARAQFGFAPWQNGSVREVLNPDTDI